MIIVLSSSPREAGALAAIAGRHPRTVLTCSSMAQFRNRLRLNSPAIVVTRTRLVDGYSDDVIALLGQAEAARVTRVIVLAGADCTPRQEARQLSLGADCVLRDPLRPDVLSEYLAKFLKMPAGEVKISSPQIFHLAEAAVLVDSQQLQRDGQSVHLTPKEIELARLLAESQGAILTYDRLYADLFDRGFPGESANLRVLLGKLVASYRRLGIDLRKKIRVLPKRGYQVASPVIKSVEPEKKKKPRPKSRL